MSNERLAPEHLFDLRGRVALVTGASSGLGVSFARGLAMAGADVIALGRRKNLLDDLVSDLPEAIAVECDLADDADIARAVEAVNAYKGRLDILVNNAGVPGPGVPAQQESLADFDATMNVNLRAAYALSKGVFPLLRSSDAASVVNVTSISGSVGVGHLPQAAYAASKHALTGLTRELALQWARFGIRVNALAPGFVSTDMTTILLEQPQLAEWVQANTPLARFAHPDDLVGPLLLVASSAGRGVTGQVLHVDNGWTAR